MNSKLTILLVFLILSTYVSAQNTKQHKGLPVLNANSDWTKYRVGQDWYPGWWSVAPQVAHDTLTINCYGAEESFGFWTDADSIEFNLKANTSKSFYVKLGEQYAHTIIQGVAFQPDRIKYDSKAQDAAVNIKYQTGASDYLEELKKSFPLNFIKDGMNDTEVVLAVLNWTNSRWDHNGNNSPSKNDAITILNEASEGQQFPCFAYAIVLRDQLNALGYKARTVYLKTGDAKHRTSPPGHVATEVYLEDLQKWVFVDGQFNVMPFLDGTPLNAVEFQNAIGEHYDTFELRSLASEKATKRSYVDFVYDYLFYLDTTFDNRYEREQRHTVNEKRSIMLVPVGAEELSHINFWNMDVDYCLYTNSLKDFYAKPK